MIDEFMQYDIIIIVAIVRVVVVGIVDNIDSGDFIKIARCQSMVGGVSCQKENYWLQHHLCINSTLNDRLKEVKKYYHGLKSFSRSHFAP